MVSSKKLNVTQKEFLNSFKFHYRTYQALSDDEKYVYDRRLILFYAVECGLKCWIMKNNALKDYYELKEYAERKGIGDFSHNIKEMLKDRNMSEKYILKNLKTLGGQRVEPKHLNQFWRYGVHADDREAENKNEKVLNDIAMDLLKRL